MYIKQVICQCEAAEENVYIFNRFAEENVYKLNWLSIGVKLLRKMFIY